MNDLIIIGGGTAGFAAATKASELGANTLMVNDNAVGFGGTCINVGCMPTKRLLHVGEALSNIRNPGIKSVNTSISFDFTTIMEENEKMVKRLRNATSKSAPWRAALAVRCWHCQIRFKHYY